VSASAEARGVVCEFATGCGRGEAGEPGTSVRTALAESVRRALGEWCERRLESVGEVVEGL
jgi:hypothetical protein